MNLTHYWSLILQQLTLSIQLKKKAAAVLRQNQILDLGSVSACSKVWFLSAFVFLERLEWICWLYNHLLLFLNYGFMSYIEHFFFNHITQRIIFLFERSMEVSGSHLCIWLFGCLKFTLHLFSDTYNLLIIYWARFFFSSLRIFFWQNVVKTRT